MTDAVASAPAPKTPMSKKKLLVIITTVLALLGLGNHFTYQFGYATVDISVSDSTVSVVASPVEAPVVAVDTTKKDTTKTK